MNNEFLGLLSSFIEKSAGLNVDVNKWMGAALQTIETEENKKTASFHELEGQIDSVLEKMAQFRLSNGRALISSDPRTLKTAAAYLSDHAQALSVFSQFLDSIQNDENTKAASIEPGYGVQSRNNSSSHSDVPQSVRDLYASYGAFDNP